MQNQFCLSFLVSQLKIYGERDNFTKSTIALTASIIVGAAIFGACS